MRRTWIGEEIFQNGHGEMLFGFLLSQNSAFDCCKISVSANAYADSVAAAFRTEFDVKADNADDGVISSGFENIHIDVHPPVIDLPDLPARPSKRVLSNAVVQGSFDPERRNYTLLFESLTASLASMWVLTKTFHISSMFLQKIRYYGDIAL